MFKRFITPILIFSFILLNMFQINYAADSFGPPSDIPSDFQGKTPPPGYTGTTPPPGYSVGDMPAGVIPDSNTLPPSGVMPDMSSIPGLEDFLNVPEPVMVPEPAAPVMSDTIDFGSKVIMPKDPFEAALTKAVLKAFEGRINILSNKIAQIIAPQIEAAAPQIIKLAAAKKIGVDSIRKSKSGVANMGDFPSADTLSKIPAKALEQAKATAVKKAQSSISEQFSSLKSELVKEIQKVMDSLTGDIITVISPYIQAMLPKISEIIEQEITKNIDANIIQVLPDILTLIPDNMSKMSPEQIAAAMEAKIRPQIEKTVRPYIKEKIEIQLRDTILNKVEKPIENVMKPEVDDMTLVDTNINSLPSHIEKLISKQTIRNMVVEQVKQLHDKLPQLIEQNKNVIRKEIETYLDNEIENMLKIYINGRISTISKPQMINGQLMIPFSSLNSLIGAKTQYDLNKKQITVSKGTKVIVLTLNSGNVLVNGKKLTAAKPYLESKMPMVPAEFITETFGYQFEWQPDWEMVTIKN